MKYKYLIGFTVLFFVLVLVIQSIDYIGIINNINSTDIFEPEYDTLQDDSVLVERRFKLGRQLEITAEIKYKYKEGNTPPYEVVEIYSSAGSYISPGIIYTPVKQTGEVRWNEEINNYEIAYSIDYMLTLGFAGRGDKPYGIKRAYSFKDAVEIENAENDANSLEYISEYEFYEYCPPNMNMVYEIKMYEEQGKRMALINVDGFQTLIRFKADVMEEGNKINLVLKEKLENDMTDDRYVIEDSLLSLSVNESDVITTWGKMKPMLKENENNPHCFAKKQ